MNQVVISVEGGVAYIAYASKNVKVAIVDFDNAKQEGKNPLRVLGYWLGLAKKDEKRGSRHKL